MVQLRLAPTRNNQLCGINWARDYELTRLDFAAFGAVAQLGERVTGSHEVAGSSPAGSTSSSVLAPVSTSGGVRVGLPEAEVVALGVPAGDEPAHPGDRLGFVGLAAELLHARDAGVDVVDVEVDA